jgi:hypothetical protein
MKNIISVLLIAGLLICWGCEAKKTSEDSSKDVDVKIDNSPAEKDAIVTAKSWLALIDLQEYDKSWDEAAEIFQKALPKEQWVSTIENVKLNFGKAIKRELISATYKTTLPGAPDGKYVIIQFKTKFEKKESAVETITPMQGNDGEWRVSGYFIK